MTKSTAATSIFSELTFEPTRCQAKALYELEEFLSKPNNEKVFVLNGSAGTGKTTLTKAIVNYLNKENLIVELIAPTGKAASILKQKSGYNANTIHHLIYVPEQLENGKIQLNYKGNDSNARTIFIVDEASMIASTNASIGDFISSRPLLKDFISFVLEGNIMNQIVFLGDNNQLKPINENKSVALSLSCLEEKYALTGRQINLSEVVRQGLNSPVLQIANDIIIAKKLNKNVYGISTPKFQNISKALAYYMYYFDPKNLDEVITICKSNKEVKAWNNAVREELCFIEDLCEGDVVMLRNRWLNNDTSLVNGDIGIIKSVSASKENVAGILFKDIEVVFKTIDGDQLIKSKVYLDLLDNEHGGLDVTCMKNLKANRMKANTAYRSSQRAQDDPYMNAMKLNYAYALTCHKAQGSEWERVLYTSKLHPADHEWLYTAVTRAKKEILTWWFK